MEIESNTAPAKKLKRVEVAAELKHVAAWKKAAKENGQDLTNWIRSTLIAAAKQQRPK